MTGHSISHNGEPAAAVWAINGRYVTQRMTGVQRYAHEIVAALDRILMQDREAARRLRLRLVLPPGADQAPLHSQIDQVPTRRGRGHAWDQLVLPWHASSVLSLGNFGPVLARQHIVCIHDANTFIQPESYSRGFGIAYRTLLPLVGRTARRVATVSQFSADMLVAHGVCGREKIFIAPNGHEHALRWDASRARVNVIRPHERPYVLLLGSSAKHKNIEIVLAQSQALDENGIDIVIVGSGSTIFSAVATEGVRPNVHYTGYVGDDDLAGLYEGALCLAFPSRTEGFGIPPLEAMARGCPVVSSTAASLTEVGGDAVAYIDPDDGNGWRDALIALAMDPGRRAAMSAQGRKRAGLFSWQRSAEIYLDEMLRLNAVQ
jgi:glycosyltransferase involved in cell wall biosynthesis